MTQDPLSQYNARHTYQMERARPDQIRNDAGGYVFAVDDMQRALRFLILGTAGGTYYVNEREFTRENAQAIRNLAADPGSGPALVRMIVDVSESGRAAKQNPTLFALAVCAASPVKEVRWRALDAIPKVCRTGTHLFIFARYVEQFRGWGRGLRRAIAKWYERDVDKVAYQAVKYRQREGWSHRDLLRLSHPKAESDEAKGLYSWITHGDNGEATDVIPRIVHGFEVAQRHTTPGQWVEDIQEFGLSWEMLPDEALKSPKVWEALIPGMGVTALIRNLNRLTNMGVISPMTAATDEICQPLTNQEALVKARVHPLFVLTALATYKQGRGLRGGLSWIANPSVVDALDTAFYLAFGSVNPANKRTLLGLDVSGSMGVGNVAGSPLRPVEAEAAMAMVHMRTEPQVFPMAFARGFMPLGLTKQQSLDAVLREMQGHGFDGTDCSVPMTWAMNNRVDVDTFIVYTDNETWAGRMHPYQALVKYREQTGIDARMVVVGMTSNGFSIADPQDGGMLDVVGFDTAAPELINSFSRGDL